MSGNLANLMGFEVIFVFLTCSSSHVSKNLPRLCSVAWDRRSFGGAEPVGVGLPPFFGASSSNHGSVRIS